MIFFSFFPLVYTVLFLLFQKTMTRIAEKSGRRRRRKETEREGRNERKKVA